MQRYGLAKSDLETDTLYWQGSKAELVFTIDTGSLWIITLPTMLGRALFILAGWFTWAARNHSWSIRNVHGGVYFWWTTILFWVVGIFDLHPLSAFKQALTSEENLHLQQISSEGRDIMPHLIIFSC